MDCPHENCGWSGNLVPSPTPGGPGTAIAAKQRVWFRCPRCQGDWEGMIIEGRAVILPAVEQGG